MNQALYLPLRKELLDRFKNILLHTDFSEYWGNCDATSFQVFNQSLGSITAGSAPGQDSNMAGASICHPPDYGPT